MWAVVRRHPLATILVAALVLRLVAAVGVQVVLETRLHRDFLVAGDAEGYWALAGKIARGEPYEIHHPPRRVLRMPGFPALLAVPRLIFGDRTLPTRLLLAGVGTLGCYLVSVLGRELVDVRVGYLAAALVAVSPALVGFGALVLSETLFAVALLAGLLALLKLDRIDDRPSLRRQGLAWAAVAGAGIAVACYVRPSWLLAAPVFGAYLVLVASRRREAALRAAVLLAAVVVALAPWAWRNHRVTGHWVFTTLWAGPSLYDGLNPRATGASDMTFFDRENLMWRMSEYEVDRHYRRRAWAFVREHPGRALVLAGRKLARFFSPVPLASQLSQWWLRAPIAAFFALVFLPAAYAAFSRRRDARLLLFTAGPLLYFAAIHMVFVGSMRYRLPAEYPLCVLSAVGLRDWWSAGATTT